MEKLFRIISLIGMMAFAVCLPIVAQETGTEPGTDYDAVFASLAAIVAMIPVIVEGIKALFPKMPSWLSQVLSWVIGIAVCMFCWWQDLGFLSGLDWYIALLYGLGSGLGANGIADTGFMAYRVVHQEKECLTDGLGRVVQLPGDRGRPDCPVELAGRAPAASEKETIGKRRRVPPDG